VALGIAFLLAFSVGANDVSNSFGTSVGSKVLTVTQACILATIFEVAGATLLGYSVCDTFRKKMYDVSAYEGAQYELMLGALSCLIGSATWNIIATALKMPISGTHSIVGATIGFSMILRWNSIRWADMIRIVTSWFVSPLLSGLISSVIYFTISKTIIRKIDPLRHGLKALPFFYGVTVFINVASVVIDGPEFLSINELPLYAGIGISLMSAAVAIFFVASVMVPKLRREIMDELMSRGGAPKPMGRPSGRPSHTPASRPPVQGHDNPSFKKDEKLDGPEVGPQRQTEGDRKEATFAPRDELSLDPRKLAGMQKDDSAGPESRPELRPTSGGPSKRRGPPVAPKPAHLRRQRAQDASLQGPSIGQGENFEEIDLSPVEAARKVPQVDRPKAETVIEVDPGKKVASGAPQGPSGPTSKMEALASCGERYEIARLFASLQILTACFASFAHGTNDVSNAVAPLIPIWNIYTTGEEKTSIPSQIWILLFGSIGICCGLWAWGRAVMSTISGGLTKITPSKGFSVELGAAISVLLATKLGLPISTTHCKVGSLVIVGFVSQKFLSKDKLLDQAAIVEQQSSGTTAGGQRLEIMDAKSAGGAAAATKGESEEGVDWKMFGNIAITWIVTVPLAAAVSASVMLLLKWLLL